MNTVPQTTLQSDLSNLETIVHAAGLDHLSARIAGDTFAVCDLGRDGVQGCADIRNAILQQHIIADLVALGMCIFVAVMVGSLAVAFVHLFAKALRPIQRRRQAKALVAV